MFSHISKSHWLLPNNQQKNNQQQIDCRNCSSKYMDKNNVPFENFICKKEKQSRQKSTIENFLEKLLRNFLASKNTLKACVIMRQTPQNDIAIS